jgi:hypothetical protein
MVYSSLTKGYLGVSFRIITKILLDKIELPSKIQKLLQKIFPITTETTRNSKIRPKYPKKSPKMKKFQQKANFWEKFWGKNANSFLKIINFPKFKTNILPLVQILYLL